MLMEEMPKINKHKGNGNNFKSSNSLDHLRKAEDHPNLSNNFNIPGNNVSTGISSELLSTAVRNISRKNSVGSNNWKKFMEMEGKSSSVNVSSGNIENKKLPLMKSGLCNENKDKSVFQLLSRPRRPGQKAILTKLVGMDCEMVGVGEDGSINVLARVSLVNSFGECVYDKYVKPTAKVIDYRTFVSGIRPHHLEKGVDFFKVQQEVAGILKGRTLIGHALKHDFEVLMLRHPRRFTRDTATFLKFRKEAKGSLSLKNLANEFLGVKIQDGEHDSIEDAKAAMQLYMTYRKEWEHEIHTRWLQQNKKGMKGTVIKKAGNC